MNYEQKYKEALEWAKSIYPSTFGADREDLEHFFPELAESKEEKIRKALLNYYRNCSEFYCDGFDRDMVIAWLERQGEKPIDKVEPKFKVGDWVIDTHGRVNQVTSITDDGYAFCLYDGTYVSGCWKDYYHLWTIKDAKDGDVIVVPKIFGFEHSEQIFIFKEIKDRKYVKNAVEYYCRYRIVDNEFCVNEMGFMGQSNNYFVPATKKQRDLLFQKMKEAGYEWDANKKELKRSNGGVTYGTDRQN